MKKSKGLKVALTAATIFAAAPLIASSTAFANEGHDHTGKVKCWGINSCAGHNDCATAHNACKGHGSCKGKGWLYADSKEDCLKKEGKVHVEEEAETEEKE